MKNKGFTLIELLIALAVIAILASVAVPAYTGYVQLTRRADAKAALYTLAAAMERRHSVNNTYEKLAVAGENIGFPASTLFKMPSGISSFYEVRITDAKADSFAVEAKPKAGQTKDPCGTLTLTDTGKTGADTGGCW